MLKVLLLLALNADAAVVMEHYDGASSTISTAIVIATKTADQLVGQSVATNILFQANVYREQITHSNTQGSSTFTFIQPGVYFVSCMLQFDASAIGTRQITMLVGSATIANIKSPAALSGLSPMSAQTMWYMV